MSWSMKITKRVQLLQKLLMFCRCSKHLPWAGLLGSKKSALNEASVSDLDQTHAQHFLVRAGNVSWLRPPPGALSRHEQKALTQGRKMRRDMSEASHSEDVEIVRRGFGQHFNATYAIALLAKSRLAVIFFVETVFRLTARTNLPLALDTYSP